MFVYGVWDVFIIGFILLSLGFWLLVHGLEALANTLEWIDQSLNKKR